MRAQWRKVSVGSPEVPDEPAGPRAAQAAFACYATLAILLWLFILAMGHQPGAVAAMHALQG